MLDAYIIEEIKRQEEERRQRDEARPRLRIEIPRPQSDRDDRRAPDDEQDDAPAEERDNRDGVIRIDL